MIMKPRPLEMQIASEGTESESLLTPAQLANVAGGFAPGAGISDFLGQYPAFPDDEASIAEMLRGQRELSASENFGQGNYVTAGLQGLGAIGDLAMAVPVVGPAVGGALKAPNALRKYMRIIDQPNEILAKQELRKDMTPSVTEQSQGRSFGIDENMKEYLQSRGMEPQEIAELNTILKPTKEQMEKARALGYDPDRPIYHGTYKDFDIFEDEFLDPDSFAGKGVYGSTTYQDARQNYATTSGPDVQVKIDNETEKRTNEFFKNKGIAPKDVDSNEYNPVYKKIRLEVEAELDYTKSKVFELWAKTNKHAIIGKDIDDSTIIKGQDWWEETLVDLDKDLTEASKLDLDIPENEEIYENALSLYEQHLLDYGSPAQEVLDAFHRFGTDPKIVQDSLSRIKGFDLTDQQITANDVLKMIDDIDIRNGFTDEVDVYGDMMGLGEIRRTILEELGFEGVIDKTPRQRFPSIPFMDYDTEHVITFPRFKSNVKSSEAIFDEKTPTRPELFLNDGGIVQSMLNKPDLYTILRDDRTLRDRHMEELEKIESGLLDNITSARASNIAGMFAPGAGLADMFGAYPEFPDADATVGEMLTGERAPSLAENIEEGNYGTAALQGLGGLGDALYAIPVVGPLAGATVGSVLKAPLAISKAVKAVKNLRNVDTANPNTIPEVDKIVYTPLVKDVEGVEKVKQLENDFKLRQENLESTDDIISRASQANPDFQGQVQEIANLTGTEKASSTITTKTGEVIPIELKTKKSMDNKIERKKIKVDDITDSLRTSIYIDTAEQGDEIVNLLSEVYPVIDRGFLEMPTGYFDRTLNILVPSPEGNVIAELQILTKPMAKAKGEGHRMYEVERELIKRYGGEKNIPESHVKRFENIRNAQIDLYGQAKKDSDQKILENMIDKFKDGGAVSARHIGDIFS